MSANEVRMFAYGSRGGHMARLWDRLPQRIINCPDREDSMTTPRPTPTTEERLSALEAALDELITRLLRRHSQAAH